MKNRIWIYAVSLILVLCLAGPCMAAKVMQGKCISNDQDKKVLVMEEYDLNQTPENKFHGNPTGKQATFQTGEAVIGITPAPGDVVRVAYTEKGNDKVAVRIMNVSKQDLMKK